MAVAYRSQSVATTTNTTSHTCSMPSGLVAGDMLLMLVKMGKSASAVPPTTPGGWTKGADHNNSQFGFDHNYAVYSRLADGSEGANITLTTASAEYGHIVIVAYSGAATVVFADRGAAQTTTSATVPSVTTTAANAILAGVLFVNSSAAGGTTPAAGWTQRVDQNEANLGDLIYMMDKAQAVAGASATGTATLSFARNNWAYTYAVQPPTSTTWNGSSTVSLTDTVTTAGTVITHATSHGASTVAETVAITTAGATRLGLIPRPLGSLILVPRGVLPPLTLTPR